MPEKRENLAQEKAPTAFKIGTVSSFSREITGSNVGQIEGPAGDKAQRKIEDKTAGTADGPQDVGEVQVVRRLQWQRLPAQKLRNTIWEHIDLRDSGRDTVADAGDVSVANSEEGAGRRNGMQRRKSPSGSTGSNGSNGSNGVLDLDAWIGSRSERNEITLSESLLKKHFFRPAGPRRRPGFRQGALGKGQPADGTGDGAGGGPGPLNERGRDTVLPPLRSQAMSICFLGMGVRAHGVALLEDSLRLLFNVIKIYPLGTLTENALAQADKCNSSVSECPIPSQSHHHSLNPLQSSPSSSPLSRSLSHVKS